MAHRPEDGPRHERRGFDRFPFSEEGLISLAVHLVSEGHGGARPEWPDLPPPDAPETRRALEIWALVSALVPDPTWAQLQAAREALPEVRAVFPRNRHLQSLLDWLETRTGHRAESPDGTTLDIPQDLVDRLIEENRAREAGVPPGQTLEGRARRMLLQQLDGSAPADPFMLQFWELTRMRHQLALEPERAMRMLGGLFGGAWHEEALGVVGEELRRDSTRRWMRRSTLNGLRAAIDPNAGITRLLDLVLLPRLAALVGAATLGLLLVASFAALENAAPVRDELLGSPEFEGRFPDDYEARPTEFSGDRGLGEKNNWVAVNMEGMTLLVNTQNIGPWNVPFGFSHSRPELIKFYPDGSFFKISNNILTEHPKDTKFDAILRTLNEDLPYGKTSEVTDLNFIDEELAYIEITEATDLGSIFSSIYDTEIESGDLRISSPSWSFTLKTWLHSSGWVDIVVSGKEYTIYSVGTIEPPLPETFTRR